MTSNVSGYEAELTLRHPNGRAVRASIIGAPASDRVVVYHHGFPACRLEALFARKIASDLNLKIVAVDRPGFGGSEYYSGRKLEDCVDDVQLVTDHIGASSFYILGVSGGAPTAVVTAALAPERVRGLAIVSGMAPVRIAGVLDRMNFANRGLLRLSRTRPDAAASLVRTLAHVWRHLPLAAGVWLGTLLPRSDIAVVGRRDVRRIMARVFKEALRVGVEGAVTDFRLMASDWEPYFGMVKARTTIWHGTADTYVPFAMGRAASERIPASRFIPIENGGHFMVIDQLSSILHDLVAE